MRLWLIACFFLSLTLNSQGQIATNPRGTSPVLGLHATDNQINAGLKETLLTASADAIRKTGAENGFLANDSIKIPLPEKLLNSEKGLRLMGQGLKIDEFEISMNRVAEAAAPAVAEVFNKAVADKSFSDVRAVLNGGGSAAAEELRRSAFSGMVKAFRPAVSSAMGRTSVQQEFNSLCTQYTGLTLGDKCQVDLEEYLTRNILAGIFRVTGQEEANIRGNTQAQDELLKTVFGLE